MNSNRKLFLIILISTVILNLFSSCEKDDTFDLNTKNVSEITQATAMSGGFFNTRSVNAGYHFGVVWDINPQPTIGNRLGYTIDIAENGQFTSIIENLNPNTKYYVRAFATNEYGSLYGWDQYDGSGTIYGEQFEFTTNEVIAGNGVIDIDNNEYSTVIIGEQEWMTKNLRTTKYNDGTSIPLIIEDEVWRTTSTPAYCWYDNDKAKYGDAYGALYNFHVVETGKLCPTGWHVATDEEWTILFEYAGGSNAGGKLKSTRVSPDDHPRWDTPNTYATNAFGFSALPTGCRWGLSSFYNIEAWGYWWSSTVEYENDALGRTISNESGGYVHGNFSRNDGFAVRCIKNSN